MTYDTARLRGTQMTTIATHSIESLPITLTRRQ